MTESEIRILYNLNKKFSVATIEPNNFRILETVEIVSDQGLWVQKLPKPQIEKMSE